MCAKSALNVVDSFIEEVDLIPESYESFFDAIRVTSRKHMPGGSRCKYIPGLSE